MFAGRDRGGGHVSDLEDDVVPSVVKRDEFFSKRLREIQPKFTLFFSIVYEGKNFNRILINT